MSWNNITGDEKILPSGGNANEVILESGKAKVIRLLLPGNSEPYSFFEHPIEVEIPGANGQMTKQFRTVRCPKTSKNPNASCPLCDGQKVRRRIRHACNVFDIEENKVQKFTQGDDVFRAIATTRKLGVDILGVNWAVLRTGTDRNDTTYSATNLGPSPFELPAGSQLFDIESEYAPHSVDDIKAIVESIGGDWNDLITLPNLTFPTLQEALAHKMPNGKHKDKTFEVMWNEDKTNRGMIYYLAMKSDRVNEEKAAAQVILANLGGIAIPGVPVNGVTPSTNVGTTTQIQTQNTQQTASASTSTPAQTTAVSGRQDKINKVNTLFSTKEVFVKGGYQMIVETLKKAGNGKSNIVDFSDGELDALISACETA